MNHLKGIPLNDLSVFDKNKITNFKDKLKLSFPNLYFDEEYYKYNYKGWEMSPVTTFIERFKKKFDTQIIQYSKYKANLKEYGDTIKNPSYYKKRWELIGKEASTIGTRVHHFAQAYPHFEEPICEKEEGIIEFFKWLDVVRYVVLFNEFKLYDETYCIAGTIDLLLYDLQTDSIIIVDWKTNNKSIFEYDSGSKLLKPFHNYNDTKFNNYSIQLNHYEYLLKKKGFNVSEKWIVWLNNEITSLKNPKKQTQRINSEFKSKLFRIYKCLDMPLLLDEYFEENALKILEERRKAGIGEKIAIDGILGKFKPVLPKIPKLTVSLNSESRTKKEINKKRKKSQDEEDINLG